MWRLICAEVARMLKIRTLNMDFVRLHIVFYNGGLRAAGLYKVSASWIKKTHFFGYIF
jgi:hypothetical protein